METFVLNACMHDWSNFSHENAKALLSVGIKCKDIKEKLHHFSYETQSEISKKFHAEIDQADIVQIMHSDTAVLKFCKAQKKRCVVYNTGTNYRLNPDTYNSLFNPVVFATATDETDLLGLGGINEHLISMTVDVDALTIGRMPERPYTIGHYPSDAGVKGSAKVEHIMRTIHRNRSDFFFNMSTQNMAHRDHLERIRRSDIYTEMFAPKQRGKRYGHWGTAALEAAAMGRVVVTNHVDADLYEKHYGTRTPFIICDKQGDMFKQINNLLDMDPLEMRNLQIEHRTFVEQYHSYKATGARICRMLQI